MRNKILIIDDDHVFVEATRVLLQAHGYDVISAFDGQEGFAKAKTESPDLIILDIVMNYETEGIETAKALARDAAMKGIPIIMVTALENEGELPAELKPSDENLPVKVILKKPIPPQVLSDTVKSYIEQIGKQHHQIVSEINAIVQKWKGKEGNLIMILHQIQNHYGYVPRQVSFELSRILDIPLARIYEVVTFYNYFKLEPPGKHTISLCMGTACYLKGSPQLLEEIKNVLHISEGETTPDGLFHLQAVRCLGCCGLAPVLMIDKKVYGKLKASDIAHILSEYQTEQK